MLEVKIGDVYIVYHCEKFFYTNFINFWVPRKSVFYTGWYEPKLRLYDGRL
jgi:hypothetical protein